MPVVFDSNILMLVMQPEALPCIDPNTGELLTFASERIDFLVRTLSKRRTEVLIPAPVMAEVLVNAGPAKASYIQQLQKDPFQIAPFDLRAAIECADLLSARPKVSAKVPGWKAKLKFDQQIVAIAKSRRVEAIYTDDAEVIKDAKRVGLKVVQSFELPRDPDQIQGKLDLGPTAATGTSSTPHAEPIDGRSTSSDHAAMATNGPPATPSAVIARNV